MFTDVSHFPAPNSAASDADEMDCVLMAGPPRPGTPRQAPVQRDHHHPLPRAHHPCRDPGGERLSRRGGWRRARDAVSPHETQGAPGHVAKVKASIESGEVTRKSKDGGGKLRKSLNVIGGFKKATSGLMAKLRAFRDSPETPVRRPSPKTGRGEDSAEDWLAKTR